MTPLIPRTGPSEPIGRPGEPPSALLNEPDLRVGDDFLEDLGEAFFVVGGVSRSPSGFGRSRWPFHRASPCGP